MGRTAKSKKKAPSPKKPNRAMPSSSSSSWVDQLSFRPVTTSQNVVHGDKDNNETDASTSRQNNKDGEDGDGISLSIICWNILADGYCSRNSHPGLPRQYQEVVFDRQRRGSLLRKILCRSNAGGLNADIWALQEVDTDDVLSKHMTAMGYDGIETPRMKIGSGAGGKADSCGIYYRRDRWALIDREVVRLDDLASMPASSSSDDGDDDDTDQAETTTTTTTMGNNNNNNDQNGSSYSINNNLQGLQRSFLRRNVALLVRLQHCTSPTTTIVIAVTHLFWNPAYEYVKLCQVHYIMTRAKRFLQKQKSRNHRNNNHRDDEEPLIFCGDLNSLPGSSVHTYLTRGVVNAKLVAPWFREGTTTGDGGGGGDTQDENTVDTIHDEQASSSLNGLSQKLGAALKVSDTTDDDDDDTKDPSSLSDFQSDAKQPQLQPPPPQQQHQPQQIRYLLDYNLNRLCRWFRFLGLDAGLETEEEERLRTKEGKIELFERCRAERRVLITTSNSLLARTNCPAGTYLINPRSLASNWEIVLVHILLTHGVEIDPRNFLSRCVVCNGNICRVDDPTMKRKIFADHQAPIDELDSASLDVWKCDGCQQGYWWCDRPTSSASRVKGQATKLYEMCLQAHVSTTTSSPSLSGEKHMFDHVNVEQERRKGWDWTMKGSELLKLKLQVTEWLKDEQLACPILHLQSAYRDDGAESGESIPYTNVTKDFVGLLDYIFFDTRRFALTERLHVPTTYDELNSQQIRKGHLLPSNVWPSDHLAIGATLKLRSSAAPTGGQ